MLIQLYSDTDLLLKTFRFVPGLNIVLGKYSDDKETKGINGIGKSSMIRLIDFTLLSNSAEKRFLQPKYDFLREEKHNIILEFKSQETRYFIKRTFEKGDSILFGENIDSLEEYTKPELKKILTNRLFPFDQEDVFFQGERYGTLMDFFIKDDLENQQRIDPLNFSTGTSSQTSKAIFNFFLLGLPTKDILKYDELLNEHKEFSQTAKGLENKIKIDHGKSVEEFKSERIKIEQNIELLEKSLKDYKFLENYKNLEKELIEITTKINDHLRDYHSLSRKQKKVKEAFQYSQSIDTQGIRKLYNEVLSTFGDIVSKTLDEIITFKKEILENRNKFLIAKERELQSSIEKILSEISNLEQERSRLYTRLEEKGALESITNTYEQLTLEKAELAGNLKIVQELDGLQEMMGNLHVTISEVKRDILMTLKQNETTINKFRAIFLEVLQNAIFLDDENPSGYFSISLKPESPRNQLPFKVEVEIPKADALGQSRLKIVAYDLMVFLKNLKEERVFPRFLIHDGVYHGIELNTKIKALNFMYHQHLAYPSFQYFVTFNEDEIYVPEEKKGVVEVFDFNMDDVVVAEFTDDPAKMLFKRDFK